MGQPSAVPTSQATTEASTTWPSALVPRQVGVAEVELNLLPGALLLQVRQRVLRSSRRWLGRPDRLGGRGRARRARFGGGGHLSLSVYAAAVAARLGLDQHGQPEVGFGGRDFDPGFGAFIVSSSRLRHSPAGSMLAAHLPFLNSRAVVLASQSPRRLEILGKVLLSVSVDPSRFDETLDKALFATAAGVLAPEKRISSVRGRATSFSLVGDGCQALSYRRALPLAPAPSSQSTPRRRRCGKRRRLRSGAKRRVRGTLFSAASPLIDANAKQPSSVAAADCTSHGHAAQERRPWDVIISADTVVDLGGRVLEKPADEAEAGALPLDNIVHPPHRSTWVPPMPPTRVTLASPVVPTRWIHLPVAVHPRTHARATAQGNGCAVQCL